MRQSLSFPCPIIAACTCQVGATSSPISPTIATPGFAPTWAGRPLREAIIAARQKHPFVIDAFVLLPDHFHCILTLPEHDADYAKRWRLIKLMVTKACGKELAFPLEKSTSGERRGEGKLWQRRYWEHCIRSEKDFVSHCEYIHYDPVKHGLVESPTDWEFSSVHQFLGEGG